MRWRRLKPKIFGEAIAINGSRPISSEVNCSRRRRKDSEGFPDTGGVSLNQLRERRRFFPPRGSVFRRMLGSSGIANSDVVRIGFVSTQRSKRMVFTYGQTETTGQSSPAGAFALP